MSKINQYFITPLFSTIEDYKNIGSPLLGLPCDNYNKKAGSKLIDAKDDANAISSFLYEYRDSPDTFRSYSKEIERLVLWCIHVCKKNISSLRRDDLIQYQDFLKSPCPHSQWCGPAVNRVTPDGTYNKDWRPFKKSLGASSIRVSLTIVDSLLNYLVQTGYLEGNPLAIDKRRKKRHSSPKQTIDRYLETDEIHSVLEALINYNNDESFHASRARYIILLLFFTGIRISEAAKHTMGSFIQKEKNWFIKILGKGNKIREIPIPDDLLDALYDFRLKIGLNTPYPEFKENTPLIPMKNLIQSISARRIDQIIRWAFELGANLIEKKEPRKASKLKAASAHWLRHSYVTYLLKSGASLKVAQENAGHSNIGTTIHYTHITQTDRHEATRNLSLIDED